MIRKAETRRNEFSIFSPKTKLQLRYLTKYQKFQQIPRASIIVWF